MYVCFKRTIRTSELPTVDRPRLLIRLYMTFIAPKTHPVTLRQLIMEYKLQVAHVLSPETRAQLDKK
jgi:hypothetical protein